MSDESCPWCTGAVKLGEDGRLTEHRGAYMRLDIRCPCSGLTPAEAQDKTDESIMHHAATGD